MQAVQLSMAGLPSPVDREFFETPYEVCQFVMGHLWHPHYPLSGRSIKMIDPGAGTGHWGKAVKQYHPRVKVIGVDLPEVTRAPGYDYWYSMRYQEFAVKAKKAGIQFDVAGFNPPFQQLEEFIPMTVDLLRPGGLAFVYLRLAILAGQDRATNWWPKLPFRALTTLSKRPSHTGDGISDPRTEYAIFVFQKGYTGLPTILPPSNLADKSTWTWSDVYGF